MSYLFSTGSSRPPRSSHFPYTTLFRSLLFLMIAGAANGVNLTDGLDGLAAGTGIIALFTFTAINVIAYIRSGPPGRSEEHTSELQSRFDLVCRLLLEKNNNMIANRSLS